MMARFDDILEFDTQNCTGCTACEAACVFQHQKFFGRVRSGIKIDQDLLTGEIKITQTEHCDMCPGLRKPLCIQFCPYQAISLVRTIPAEA